MQVGAVPEDRRRLKLHNRDQHEGTDGHIHKLESRSVADPPVSLRCGSKRDYHIIRKYGRKSVEVSEAYHCQRI